MSILIPLEAPLSRSYLSTFGFHSQRSVPLLHSYYQPKEAFRNALIINGLNILGYIPVLGLVPFILRSASQIFFKNHPLEFFDITTKVFQATRGIIEGLGFGAFLIIPDIFATAYRFITKHHILRDDYLQKKIEYKDQYNTWVIPTDYLKHEVRKDFS